MNESMYISEKSHPPQKNVYVPFSHVSFSSEYRYLHIVEKVNFEIFSQAGYLLGVLSMKSHPKRPKLGEILDHFSFASLQVLLIVFFGPTFMWCGFTR